MNVFAAFRFEREIMLEQAEGIAKAKSEGKNKGRKPKAREKAPRDRRTVSGQAYRGRDCAADGCRPRLCLPRAGSGWTACAGNFGWLVMHPAQMSRHAAGSERSDKRSGQGRAIGQGD